jgi:CDP-diacylglycerol--glycerol-3-phosphate 3-phosphatidyltransferase
MFFLLNESLTFAPTAALIVYVVASLTDMLDGYIARKYQLITDFGKFMDPLADKLLVIASLICFVEMNYLGAWAAMIIIARELIITGFRTLAASKGVTLAANQWGKLKTIFQMVTIIGVLIENTGTMIDLTSIIGMLWIVTVFLTLMSGAVYLFQNRSVLN